MRRSGSSESFDTSAATMMGVTKNNTNATTNKKAPQDKNGVSNSTTVTAAAENIFTIDPTLKKSEYVNYLMSYEGMVRHQDLEFDATSGHIKHIFERVQTLGSKKNIDGESSFDRSSSSSSEQFSAPRGMLTYLQIRRCLLRLNIGWKRTSSSSDIGTEYDDDSVSVLSFNSTSSLHSGGSGKNPQTDIIATDAQLIMLLTTLVEMEEIHRAARMQQGQEYSIGSKKTKYPLEQGLFLPEFIQAYKLIIGGMQSLKSIPNNNINNPSTTELSTRLKERTLGMIRPFGPNAKMYNDASKNKGATSHDEGYDSDDALRYDKNSYRSNVKGKQNKFEKKSFTNTYMKKVIRSKDSTLAKIMEEHELEMDALATSMEELRMNEERARVALRRRRKRTKVGAAIVFCIVVAGGLYIERQRRDLLDSEIEQGREAERMADLQTIALLQEKKKELEQRLGVIEGKMRYQTNRNDELEAKTQKAEKKSDDVDMKWLIDKAEIERCLASRVEINEALKNEKLKKEEIDEELTWCRSHLRSKEMELNELEYVTAGGGTSDKGVVEAEGDGDLEEGNKLVVLQMKFNKGIRNAMFLRQAYSAAAGVAVSIALQGLIPGVFRLIFAKPVVLPPPVVPVQNVDPMQIVDGVVGSSVIFLLMRALATFVMPL